MADFLSSHAPRQDAENLPTTCRLLGSPSSQPLPVRIRRISTTGVNLVAGAPCPEGTSLSLELPGVEGGPASTVLVEVVHAAEELNGHWSLGCAVAAELSEADLGALAAKRRKPAVPDRRAWVRLPCHARATYRVVQTPRNAGGVAEAVNVSAGGIGLRVAEPLALGTMLQLECRSQEGLVTLRTMARVVRQTARPEGDWEVGCLFIRPFGDAALRSFLAAHAPTPAGQ